MSKQKLVAHDTDAEEYLTDLADDKELIEPTAAAFVVASAVALSSRLASATTTLKARVWPSSTRHGHGRSASRAVPHCSWLQSGRLKEASSGGA